MMALLLQAYQVPSASSSSSSSSSSSGCGASGLHPKSVFLFLAQRHPTHPHSSLICHNNRSGSTAYQQRRSKKQRPPCFSSIGREDLDLTVQQQHEEDDDDDATPPTPQDLHYIQDIKRVLELLRKNRDMLFNEVKLTIMVEDPREVERRRLLGIDDLDAPTRDDLVEALQQVNDGKIPKNRVALRMLAEEMLNWPNLEVEVPKKKPGKSLYAKATDTGVDPKEAAKRLKIDWDAAAEIENTDNDESEVPPAVGYGALYLVTAFPIIIGISVVLILFYNSLQ